MTRGSGRWGGHATRQSRDGTVRSLVADCGSAEKTPDPTGSGKVARGWPGKGLPFREEWEDESRGLGGSSQKEKRHGRTPGPWLPPRVTLLSPGIWPGDVSGGPSWGAVSRRRPGCCGTPQRTLPWPTESSHPRLSHPGLEAGPWGTSKDLAGATVQEKLRKTEEGKRFSSGGLVQGRAFRDCEGWRPARDRI